MKTCNNVTKKKKELLISIMLQIPKRKTMSKKEYLKASLKLYNNHKNLGPDNKKKKRHNKINCIKIA